MAEAASVFASVVPSLRGWGSKLSADLRKERKQNVDVDVTPKVDQKALNRAETEVRAAAARMEKARQSEADAAGRVRVAEAALNEERDRGTAGSARAVAAEERLAKASRDASKARDALQKTENALAAARSKVSSLKSEGDRTVEVETKLTGTEKVRAQFYAFKAGLDRAAEIHTNVDLNVGPALGKVALLNGALLAIPAAAGGAAYSVGSIGAALAPAVGLAGLLPAGILGAGLAMGTLKVATSGVGDAIKNAFDPTKAKQLAEDLKQLSPEARNFVLSLQGIKPQLDAVKTATQDAFFAGLGPMLSGLARTTLPIVQGGFVRMASSINDAAVATGGWLQSTYGIGVLHALVDGLSTAFANVAQAGAPLVTSFITIGAIGAPILAQLTQGAGAVAGKFASWVGSAQGIQTIHDMIMAGIAVLQQLWTVVSNVGSILWSVFKAASDAGANFLGTLGDLTGQFAAFLKSGEGQSALVSLFQNIRAAVTAMQPGIQAVFGMLGDAISQLAPILPQVGAAFSALMIALRPLFDLLVSLVATVLPPLLGLITQYPGAFIGVGIAVFGAVKAFQAASAVSKLFKTELFGVQVAALLFGDTTRTGLIPAIGKGLWGAITAAGAGLVAFAGYIWSTVLPAIGAWIVETWAQAAAMLAAYWPVLAIIAVIGLLVAAVWLIVANWSTISDFFVGLWDTVSAAFVTAWNAIWGFLVGVWNAIWGTVVTVWGAILGFFTTIWNAIWGVVMTVWNAIVGWLTAMFYVHYDLWMQIWGAISGFFSAIWNFIASVAMTVWNAIAGFFVGAFNAFAGFFSAIWNGIVAVFTTVWNWISSIATSAWNAISAYFSAAFAAYAAFFSAVWNGIVAVFTTVWNWLSNIATTTWNAIVAFLMPAINAFAAFFSMIWNGISSFFSTIWGAISNTAVSMWNTISSFFSGAFAAFAGFFTGVWNGIRDTFVRIWQSISDEAGRIWNGIVGVVKGAVNGVIDAANWMTDKINVVLKFLLIPLIPAIPRLEAGGVVGRRDPVTYAAAGTRIGSGFVTNGPRVVVGEGRAAYPEYVVPTDPAYRGRALDLHASLSADLGISNGPGAAGQAPRGGSGTPQLADGGILGWIGNAAKGAWGGITGAASAVLDAVKDAAGWATQWMSGDLGAIKKMIADAVNSMLPGGLFGGALGNLSGKVVDAIKAKIDAAMAAAASAIGGGAAPPGAISAWIAQALAILHYPQNYAAGIYQQIMTESGGNPGAVQHGYTDINTLTGNLARGIMQVIPPTFAANALPGHGNIMNPVDNIIAGSRYALKKYGAGWFNPGPWHSHGYDSGGLAAGAGMLYKQTVAPERVLSPRQTQAFESLVPMLSAMARRGGFNPDIYDMVGSDTRGGRTVNQYITTAQADPVAVAAVARRREQFEGALAG